MISAYNSCFKWFKQSIELNCPRLGPTKKMLAKKLWMKIWTRTILDAFWALKQILKDQMKLFSLKKEQSQYIDKFWKFFVARKLVPWDKLKKLNLPKVLRYQYKKNNDLDCNCNCFWQKRFETNSGLLILEGLRNVGKLGKKSLWKQIAWNLPKSLHYVNKKIQVQTCSTENGFWNKFLINLKLTKYNRWLYLSMNFGCLEGLGTNTKKSTTDTEFAQSLRPMLRKAEVEQIFEGLR